MNTNEFDQRELLPADETGLVAVPAWEEIAAGRHMPRRIRGSYRGRVLG